MLFRSPMTRTSSSSSTDPDTFLLSSTPLADDRPQERRLSNSSGDEGLEIISRDELESERKDSDADWSDVESQLDL